MATDTQDIAASPIAQGVKRIVREFDPEAEVILYGSRARGDAQPDSDWDILVLLKGPMDVDTQRKLRRAVYELEWDSDEVICASLLDRNEWNQPPSTFTPFYENVNREGLRV